MLGPLLQPDLDEMIRQQRWDDLRAALVSLSLPDIADVLADAPEDDALAIYRILPRDLSRQVFAYLPTEMQETLIESFTKDQARAVLEAMSPDDQARLLEELPAALTRRLLESVPHDRLTAVRNLLGYPPETAGRFMTPEYVVLRADMTARDALEHVRRTGRGKETLNVLYVLDEDEILLADLRLGALVLADPDIRVDRIVEGPLVAIPASMDREEVLRAFEKYDRVALPVVDADGHMLGIITVDDILDVAAREATEDIQKIGGMEALDAPYLDVGFLPMIRKRGSWLSALFIGEMLTATAMGYFQGEIARAVVLALFVPLIISSGGNSGSQAATLIVRSLAIGELTLRDWTTVFLRELRSGATLGAWLGLLGFVRVTLWQHLGWIDYGPHYLLVALTVWLSLIGVVTFGTLTGSMLPLVLRKLGFDPATSSAPFVATLVDVTGLVIYFLVALIVLRGTLL